MTFTVGSSTCQYINNPRDEDHVLIILEPGVFDRSYDEASNTIVYRCDRSTLLKYLNDPFILSDYGILAERVITDYLMITYAEAVPLMVRYFKHIANRIPSLPPKRLWTIARFFGYTDLIQEAHDLVAFDDKFDLILAEIERRLKDRGLL